ncbi:MAG: RRXRR domain-containing protein [Clostridium sp.]
MGDLLSSRRELRRGRRNRKTRYTCPARIWITGDVEDGWLAPSIRQKIGTSAYSLRCRKHLQDPSDEPDNG